MKRLVAILALFLLATSCTIQVNVPPVEVTVKETVSEPDLSGTLASVGMLGLRKIGDAEVSGLGTAFATDYRTLVTAGHVCGTIKTFHATGAVEKEIYLTILNKADGLETKAGGVIESFDTDLDICTIKFPDHGLRAVNFGKYKDVHLNDEAYIVGAPSGVMISITKGHVMNRRVVKTNKKALLNRLVISAAAAPGHSGSPVFNKNGELIGMLVAGHSEYDHLSICVNSVVIQRFLSKGK